MRFLLQAIPGLADHIRRRRAQSQLRDMPDYLLKDIGLTREQVLGAAPRTWF